MEKQKDPILCNIEIGQPENLFSECNEKPWGMLQCELPHPGCWPVTTLRIMGSQVPGGDWRSQTPAKNISKPLFLAGLPVILRAG